MVMVFHVVDDDDCEIFCQASRGQVHFGFDRHANVEIKPRLETCERTMLSQQCACLFP